MNPDLLALGFLEYVVFLLSITCHEAAHALVAKWGGDTTALEGGQVSLNPLPHIRREPFGMVVIPILGIATQSGLIGWASAPYNSEWAAKHPRRAAWMSFAGPAANVVLALIAGVLLRIGLATGIFVPVAPSFTQIVGASSPGGALEGIATVLSVLFSLNILLGAFNLIPLPPLDGYGILGIFTTEAGARRLQEWRIKLRTLAILGLVISWQLFERLYGPLSDAGIRLLYASYR